MPLLIPARVLWWRHSVYSFFRIIEFSISYESNYKLFSSLSSGGEEEIRTPNSPVGLWRFSRPLGPPIPSLAKSGGVVRYCPGVQNNFHVPSSCLFCFSDRQHIWNAPTLFLIFLSLHTREAYKGTSNFSKEK